MTKKINYLRVVQAKAMSKSPSQKGIIVSDEIWDGSPSDVVTLYSVNAKDGNQTTYLQLQIPKEHLQVVIDGLKEFL